MQGYASREAALNILLEHEASGAFLKDMFPHFTDSLPKPDRGLVREITLGVIRNLSLLDYNIDLYAAKPPGPGAMRNILRLTAYQIFFMDVPDFAAVNVGVELAKRSESSHQGGFVNAVLKKLAAAGLQKVPGGAIKALAVNHSHPEWLLKRWYQRLGGDGMIRALERNNQEAPLFLRVNPALAYDAERGSAAGSRRRCCSRSRRRVPRPTPGEAAVESVRAQLEALGALTERDPVAKPYLKLTSRGGAEIALHSDLFKRGALAFQDPAAWFIAELADWKSGESLLDLCSAPGGKAACMTERIDYLGAAFSGRPTGPTGPPWIGPKPAWPCATTSPSAACARSTTPWAAWAIPTCFPWPWIRRGPPSRRPRAVRRDRGGRAVQQPGRHPAQARGALEPFPRPSGAPGARPGRAARSGGGPGRPHGPYRVRYLQSGRRGDVGRGAGFSGAPAGMEAGRCGNPPARLGREKRLPVAASRARPNTTVSSPPVWSGRNE